MSRIFSIEANNMTRNILGLRDKGHSITLPSRLRRHELAKFRPCWGTELSIVCTRVAEGIRRTKIRCSERNVLLWFRRVAFVGYSVEGLEIMLTSTDVIKADATYIPLTTEEFMHMIY